MRFEREGHSAKRIEIGRIRKTTGTIIETSDFEAIEMMRFLCAFFASLAWLCKTSTSGTPREIAITKESTNLRMLVDCNRFPNSSSACAKVFPWVTSSITKENSLTRTPEPRDETLCIALNGLSPAESERVSISIIEGNSDSILTRCLFTL